MGLLSKLFGGGKPSEPSAAASPAAPAAGRKACPKCQRQMLPGATACPFCSPQHFGEELPEGTVASDHKAQKGAVGMGGVIVANQLAEEHGAKGFLHVYQGKNKGASVLLADRPVTIGRSAEQNVLALNDGGASSRHCEVRPAPGGFTVADVGSKNGTFLNDVRVKEQALSNGDTISCGDTRIYVGIL